MPLNNVIIRLALPIPLRRLFDYFLPQAIDPKQLIPGVRLCVPFQSRTLVGILVEVAHQSSYPHTKLKTALTLLDDEPVFPQDVYQLCQWAANYYHHALGEVFASALPVLLRKGRFASSEIAFVKDWVEIAEKIVTPLLLNSAQQRAVQSICAARNTFQVFLLHGITGSGKTEVYLQAINEILLADQQALVLVPEISLTPQTIERFRARFSVPIAVLHSALSEQERLQVWLAAKSGVVKIVIGTRSAIFTPFVNLGLIIIDEEHDRSFKQQDHFRYHARDMAVMRASICNIPIVLGSATPSLESLCNVKRDRYQVLSLHERAGHAILPEYQLIDLRLSRSVQGLSMALTNAMQAHLEQGNQVLLFLNRRGFSPVLYCTQCGWMATCQRCDARMTYHHIPLGLQCHHCDAKSNVPACCSQCKQSALQPVGLGTQRLEQTLVRHFPTVPIIRIDRDNTRRKGAMKSMLQMVHEQKQAILIGTQILAKGHHFPQVTLVGIINADNGLFSADFRASEQMGQLLLQVAGRAGRAEKPGIAMIQTNYPDHFLLQQLLFQGYSAFSNVLLSEREQAKLPPYSYLAVFRAEARTKQHANNFLSAIKEMKHPSGITLLGPVSALLAKRKNLHCLQLLIKSCERKTLQIFLTAILPSIEKLATGQPLKWVLDVDPVEIC